MNRLLKALYPESSSFFPRSKDGLRQIVDRQLSPSVLARSVFCERTLKNEIRLGCRQYLIFASGYNTFAVRNTEKTLSVFELDLSEVLEDKKGRIDNTGLKSAAVYVPCSLENDEWKRRLFASGFSDNEKSFGSLLGISYYLKKEQLKDCCKTLAKS